MRKYSFIVLALFFFGCVQAVNKYGQGGENALQFVRALALEMQEDVISAEIVNEETLLTDRMLSLGQAQFATASSNYAQGKISRAQYQYLVDSTSLALQDVRNSWQKSNAVNDSLKTLVKYKYNWAKVYTLNVKLGNGETGDIRVLMDKDGITPLMTELQFEDQLQKYSERIIQAQKAIK